ncbi:MAG: glycoside hydrolase family 1 protein [Myxococcota bacterium]
MNELVFPPDFTFGVATSAYQVEGGIENDWSDWERAGKCKEKDARCGPSVDHWARFFDDVPLITRLGATAYRLSIEWARLEPERGRFDDAAWDGYRARLEALVKAGIRPVVTLLHFTHPKWFHVETPWHEPSSLVAWERFVRRAAELLQGLDVAVTTLNEPNVLLLGGYLAAAMPPGLADGRKAFAAMANLVRAHVLARQAIRERCGEAVPIGIAQNMLLFAPSRRWHPLDQALTRLADGNYNHAFLEALSTGVLQLQMPGFTAGKARIDGAERSTEFTGLNYYTRAHLKFVPRPPYVQFEFLDKHARTLTDIGWEWYPEGFGQILRQLKRYERPVWITENGLDDRTGTRRAQYLYEHWKELLQARADGVDVRAYLHWSLMDNFEWLEAWGPRFGLYRVDRETMARQWTPACSYFRGVATSRRLTPPEGSEQKSAA